MHQLILNNFKDLKDGKEMMLFGIDNHPNIQRKYYQCTKRVTAKVTSSITASRRKLCFCTKNESILFYCAEAG